MLERKGELISNQSTTSLEDMTHAELAHGDALDIAERNTEQERSIAMRLRHTNEIKLIDEALGKMHSGMYGACESCEEIIETKRLKARPFVKYCLECQEEMEKSEGDSTSSVSMKFDNIE